MEEPEIKEGEWVILKGDEIIAHDFDPKKIREILDERNDPELVISRELSSSSCFY